MSAKDNLSHVEKIKPLVTDLGDFERKSSG